MLHRSYAGTIRKPFEIQGYLYVGPMDHGILERDSTEWGADFAFVINFFFLDRVGVNCISVYKGKEIRKDHWENKQQYLQNIRL